MNWSNCPIYNECGDDMKDIMTYCDIQCSNPKERRYPMNDYQAIRGSDE